MVDKRGRCWGGSVAGIGVNGRANVAVLVSTRINAGDARVCGWREGWRRGWLWRCRAGEDGGGGSVERKLNMPHSISQSTIGGLRINAGR